MEHELKILPKYFEDVLDEVKTFELRKDDRNFQIGEGILLREFDGEKYTGRDIGVEIVYKLDGGKYGLEKGYCILGIEIRY
ncbi:MAG: DUF3850 domain-containing protein [Clostridium chrysemydis]|uniref:DUF3850 domain-containing protein n=1 Tax=Clostridium chrysemydis TaxID=2665504 RepID=UPI003F2A9EFF